MRWIIHRSDGSVERGTGDPPADLTGELHLVGTTEDESASLVRGALYRRGRPAGKGQHRLPLGDGGELVVDVDVRGKATVAKGGRANAGGR
jgi:hypothetical protein